MPLYVENQQPSAIFVDGNPVASVRVDGTAFWEEGGVPVVETFRLDPDKLTIGDTRGTVSLVVASSGATSGTLTAYPEGQQPYVVATGAGAFTTQPGQEVSFVTPNPQRNTHYTLALTNANGTTIRQADFLWGRLPSITTWAWGDFHQGLTGRTPDSVLLTWAVTGAVPLATLDVIPTIHYHPGMRQSGSYRLSRDRQRHSSASEPLSLVASNAFGTVRSTLTIAWPS